MGPKSEAFCSQVLALLANNPGIVPPNLGLSEAVADQKALAQLRPRFALLHQLAEKADDTEMALGSDIITTRVRGLPTAERVGPGRGVEERPPRTVAALLADAARAGGNDSGVRSRWGEITRATRPSPADPPSA